MTFHNLKIENISNPTPTIERREMITYLKERKEKIEEKIKRVKEEGDPFDELDLLLEELLEVELDIKCLRENYWA